MAGASASRLRLAGGLLVGLTAAGWCAGGQAPTFRGQVDLVPISVTVTDRSGQPVTGLSRDVFTIKEDGRPQTLAYFARGDGADDEGSPRPPLHVGILLDTSESMQEEIAFTRTAAIRFLNRLPEAVDITVVDFDTEVRATRFGQADFPRVVERIRQQKVRGLTALYDAIGTYLDGAAGQDGRKVMLLYTDADDTKSSMSRSELIELLQASDVTVYTIGAISRQSMRSRLDSERLLRQVASVTGGQAFFPNGLDDLDAAYTKIVGEIHSQYTLGYVSTNAAADGTWRKVQVNLTGEAGRNRRVRARAGYFPPLRPAP